MNMFIRRIILRFVWFCFAETIFHSIEFSLDFRKHLLNDTEITNKKKDCPLTIDTSFSIKKKKKLDMFDMAEECRQKTISSMQNNVNIKIEKFVWFFSQFRDL